MANHIHTTIAVNTSICLGPLGPGDREAIVAGLNDRAIFERTLRIPYPYTYAAADTWLARVQEAQAAGRELHFAIRNSTGRMIGGCGFHDIQVGHRAEIGYWLARDYWGRGIMTAVVARLARHAFAELGLLRLVAYVFESNRASARVLEKCGFCLEGHLRHHFVKEQQTVSALVYGRLKEEAAGDRLAW